MERINLVFFSKENTGGTVGFFSKIFPDLEYFFEARIFFYKKISKGFFIKNSTFLSQISTTGTSISPKKITQTLSNLLITIRTINGLKDNSIIIVLDLYTYILVCLSCFLAGKNAKIVYLVENNVQEVLKDNRSRLYQVILNLLYGLFIPHISEFVFTCKSLSFDFVKKFKVEKRKINIIPLGANTKKTISANEKIPQYESDLFNGITGIITVMNYTPQKDIETVIKAFTEISGKYPKLRLFIIGSGYEKEHFEKKLANLNLVKKVHFLGWKSNVLPYLKRSKIFVFSSKYEGFGVAIIEAMSIGLPVISSDTKYGPSDILGNQKYGLLYPVGNVKQLQRKIELLLEKSKIRRKYEALSRKRSLDYDTSMIAGHYRQLFYKIYNYGKSVDNNKKN